MKKRLFIIVLAMAAVLALSWSKNILTLSAKAYVYGFPLLLMDATEHNTEGVEPNRLSHRLLLPDHNFRAVVRPNNDTIYSIAWLDLSDGPQVLSIPAMGDRYFVMPLMDAWTNVFARFGTSTTGQDAQDIWVLGPDWQGDVPAQVKAVRAPTSQVWLIGRSQLNGAADMPELEQKLQAFALTDLNNYLAGERFYSQKQEQQSDRDIVAEVLALSPDVYFDRLNRLLAEQSPAPADQSLLAELQQLHIGIDLDYLANGAARRYVIAKGAMLAQSKLLAQRYVDRSGANAWSIIRSGIGEYGSDYNTRAYVALIGLGALPPAEASYPNTIKDKDGEPLRGDKKYRLRFAPGQLPPVNAFWSLTMYDREGFMVANAIDRFAIGDRDDLHYLPDGSLELLIQHQAPADTRNWLPAPAGEFAVTLRLYLPKASFLNGQWLPPAIEPQP